MLLVCNIVVVARCCGQLRYYLLKANRRCRVVVVEVEGILHTATAPAAIMVNGRRRRSKGRRRAGSVRCRPNAVGRLETTLDGQTDK